MKCTVLMTVMLAVLTTLLPASAETFVLKYGKEIEGTILRSSGRRVTLKTKSGISTYDVMEFNEKTRGEYFSDLETSVVQKHMKSSGAKEKPARKAANGLIIAGVILCVVSSLWFIIAGFAESAGWGIALLLFNGIAGLAFLILHWNRAKSPVFTYLLGLALICVAIATG